MNPTTTEHDFRFPRRPAENRSAETAGTAGGIAAPTDRELASASSTTTTATTSGAGALRESLQELRLDLTGTYDVAHGELLNSAVFPSLQDGMTGLTRTPEEMQQHDPLATQVWRFFSKTKQLLPNQERMENLTWRMMAMNLRKRRQEGEAR